MSSFRSSLISTQKHVTRIAQESLQQTWQLTSKLTLGWDWGRFPFGRSNQPVLIWDARVLRTGSGQTWSYSWIRAAQFSRSSRPKRGNWESCGGKNVRAPWIFPFKWAQSWNAHACNWRWYLITSLFVVQSNCCVSERVALGNDTRSRGQLIISFLHQTLFAQIRYFFLPATNRLCFVVD